MPEVQNLLGEVGKPRMRAFNYQPGAVGFHPGEREIQGGACGRGRSPRGSRVDTRGGVRTRGRDSGPETGRFPSRI